MNKLIKLAIIVAVGAATACASTPTRRSFKEGWRDSTIKSRVGYRLMRDKEVKGRNVEVDVWRGVVTLTGRATSAQEKAKAEKITMGVPKVKEVENYIKVISNQLSVTSRQPALSKIEGLSVIGDRSSVASDQKTVKPRGRFGTSGQIAIKKEAPKAEVPAEKVQETELIEASKAPSPPHKGEGGVSYEIRKELAITGEPADVEAIAQQAEEELKELKEMKKQKGK